MPTNFTLDKAHSLLPTISHLLREAMASRAEMADAERALRGAVERIALMGGVTVNTAAPRESKRRMEEAAERMRVAVDGIQELGCVPKDLEIGLVDFPTTYRGRDVLLCWKLGEPEIQYWHGADEGFAGRKAIDRDFRERHGAAEA
jgi:hypothetical protein